MKLFLSKTVKCTGVSYTVDPHIWRTNSFTWHHTISMSTDPPLTKSSFLTKSIIECHMWLSKQLFSQRLLPRRQLPWDCYRRRLPWDPSQQLHLWEVPSNRVWGSHALITRRVIWPWALSNKITSTLWCPLFLILLGEAWMSLPFWWLQQVFGESRFIHVYGCWGKRLRTSPLSVWYVAQRKDLNLGCIRGHYHTRPYIHNAMERTMGASFGGKSQLLC